MNTIFLPGGNVALGILEMAVSQYIVGLILAKVIIRAIERKYK